MKACTIHENGGLEVLRLEEIPDPTPAADEVLVEIKAAALNHLDIWVRKGRPGAMIKAPHVLGSDAAGVVVETGENITRWKAGDEVILNPGINPEQSEFTLRGQHSEDPSFGIFGLSRAGTFAQKVCAPAINLYPKPEHLSFAEAAALPLAHLTAFRMLFSRAQLGPGETVLIHGIGGGVALAGLQFAKLAGAEAIVTSSSSEKLEKAMELGAAHAINYREVESVAKKVLEITGGRGVDVVLDTVGASTFPINLEALRKGGRSVHCGVTSGASVEANLQAIYWKQLSILGSTMGSPEDFRRMVQTVSATQLRPVIDKVFPLAEAKSAIGRMEEGEQFGKIVLEMPS